MTDNCMELKPNKIQNFSNHDNSKSESMSVVSTRKEFAKTFCSTKFSDDVNDFYESPSKENINGEFQLHCEQTSSIVDGLLWEIYDRWLPRKDSVDSDTYTDNSDIFQNKCFYDRQLQSDRLNKPFLQTKDVQELFHLLFAMKRSVAEMSGRLVQQLRRREHRVAHRQKSYDVITAILQAASLKRRIDTQLRFSVDPLPGDSGFQQWHDAMKAVVRLPGGTPREFRKRLWLTLADNHIKDLKLDWEKTKRFTFNEKSNPDDNKLGVQIVKDLHRTGCSGFCGQDAEHDRAVLKRVLLAYARWNKNVGYCQGFNMLAALILEVVERKEDDALKVMIFLIDHVLPGSYFANNLRALSVDMAVFRDLLRLKLPHLAKHLEKLQAASGDSITGTCYEPPLTNVFTMQWFLTLFATCLPMDTVLRVWDCVLLEGSEILLRTALAIWAKLTDCIMVVDSADEFYGTMGELSHAMLELQLIKPDDLIKTIYSLAPFPFPGLNELRDKYTYNITPLSAAVNASKKGWRGLSAALFSDDEEFEEEDLAAVTCFAGIFPPISPCKDQCDLSLPNYVGSDISVLGPGAFSPNPDSNLYSRTSETDKMTMDMAVLKQQYKRLIQRAKEAQVIIAGARQQASSHRAPLKESTIDSSTVAMNHLFVGKKGMKGKNRRITPGPVIGMMPSTTTVTTLHKATTDKKLNEKDKKVRATDIDKNYPPPIERKSSGDDSSSDSSESRISAKKSITAIGEPQCSSKDSSIKKKLIESSSDSSEPRYTPQERSPESDNYSEQISCEEIPKINKSHENQESEFELKQIEKTDLTIEKQCVSDESPHQIHLAKSESSTESTNGDKEINELQEKHEDIPFEFDKLYKDRLLKSEDDLHFKMLGFRRKSLDFARYEERKKSLSTKSESQADSSSSADETSFEKASFSPHNESDTEYKEDSFSPNSKSESSTLKTGKMFNPFPSRPRPKAPKSKVGIQLGLYKPENSSTNYMQRKRSEP